MVTAMDDFDHLAALIRELYPAGELRLSPIARYVDPDQSLCLAEQPGGSAWVVKAYREDLVPPELVDSRGARDMASLLANRAATLIELERYGYDAPRVVPTRAGATMGAARGWLLLATTFLAGAIAQPTLQQLELAGAGLGRLHALGPSARAGWSWWHPAAAIPRMRGWLAAAAPYITPEWADLYAACGATADAIAARPDLPSAIIHGDAWAANMVQRPAGALTLIDWDNAGLGLAVVDLGSLLVECHVDQDQPNGGWVQPDAARIGAVLRGYTQARALPAAERAALPEVLCFDAAYMAAWRFAQLRAEGYSAATLRRLGRARNRFAARSVIAELALSQLS
jgi:Ser/Thr protein kinase RdoA (MazF antagonist)